jgi:hypothetical protein
MEVEIMIYTIQEIKSKLQLIAEKYQLAAIYLFGSYARGTADEKSDIDLAVDLSGSMISGLMFFELEETIQSLFTVPVDVLTVDEIMTGKSYIIQQLRKQYVEEKEVLYEARTAEIGSLVS